MRTRSKEEAALLARFAKQYEQSESAILLDVERAVCGCDYGGTSWTTKHEAHLIAILLELGPGKRLLDIGAGSGWPGLYLARISACDVTLADIPIEGLHMAARRAVVDGLAGSCWSVAADGALLPFVDGSFDVVGHSDVLCCLEDKLGVLGECRRVIRLGGKMAFTVISIASSLAGANHRRAVAAGPPFKAVSTDYPEMLTQTGWRMLDYIDMTKEYGNSVRAMIKQEQARADALRSVLGDDGFAELKSRRSRTVAAIEDGLLTRELFAATTAD